MPPRATSRDARHLRPRRERPARHRVHELVDTIGGPGIDDEESVRRARQVLKLGSRASIEALFRRYQVLQASTRWGVDNPLDEILGVLRIEALRSLRGPPGPDRARHEAALPVLWAAARPQDLPLLTALLEQDDTASDALYWALNTALSSFDPVAVPATLLAALERRATRGPTARESQEPIRTLGHCDTPAALDALERLLAHPDPWVQGMALGELLQRGQSQHQARARELLADLERREQLARDRSPEAYEPEVGPVYPWMTFHLRHDLEESESVPEDVAVGAGAWLAELAEATPERQVEMLRGAGEEPPREASTRFFRVVWPLTSSAQDELLVAAVRACAATGSNQAIRRLRTRARKAREAGDERTARLTEQGLAEGQEARSGGQS